MYTKIQEILNFVLVKATFVVCGFHLYVLLTLEQYWGIHTCWDRKLPSACLEHVIQSWRAEGATTHICGKRVVLCAAADVLLPGGKT